MLDRPRAWELATKLDLDMHDAGICFGGGLVYRGAVAGDRPDRVPKEFAGLVIVAIAGNAVSLLFETPLTFSIAPVYIGALLLTALALWQITGDGEATKFEGVALIALYVILAVLTFYE